MCVLTICCVFLDSVTISYVGLDHTLYSINYSKYKKNKIEGLSRDGRAKEYTNKIYRDTIHPYTCFLSRCSYNATVNPPTPTSHNNS